MRNETQTAASFGLPATEAQPASSRFEHTFGQQWVHFGTAGMWPCQV